jgi:hypothetical protein
MKQCEYCRVIAEYVKPRRTPDGDAGDLCPDCWNDVQGKWTSRRDQ